MEHNAAMPANVVIPLIKLKSDSKFVIWREELSSNPNTPLYCMLMELVDKFNKIFYSISESWLP